MKIYLLSRADDFGSTESADHAILEGIKCAQVIRNVSCMAVGKSIERGAEELRKYSSINVGIHLTLNSEWEGVRWGPISQSGTKAGVTETDGTFLRSRASLAKAKTDVRLILREFDAQLDKLTNLGLNIVYADTHMGPEFVIEGLNEAFSNWCERKGLINADDYYFFAGQPIPSYSADERLYLKNVEQWLNSLEKGYQYFYLTHPASGRGDRTLFYNEKNPRGKVLWQRMLEYIAVTSNSWELWKERESISLLRYQDAKKQKGGMAGVAGLLNIGGNNGK